MEPSVIPGQYRSKPAQKQAKKAPKAEATPGLSTLDLKEQEDKLKQARYRKQVGRGQAQVGFAEMREGLLRLRQ